MPNGFAMLTKFRKVHFVIVHLGSKGREVRKGWNDSVMGGSRGS